MAKPKIRKDSGQVGPFFWFNNINNNNDNDEREAHMPGQGVFIIPALQDLITSIEKLLPSPAPFLEWEFLLTLLC